MTGRVAFGAITIWLGTLDNCTVRLGSGTCYRNRNLFGVSSVNSDLARTVSWAAHAQASLAIKIRTSSRGMLAALLPYYMGGLGSSRHGAIGVL